MDIADAFSAFQTTAGVSPDKVSLYVRSILSAFFMVWAAWCIYGQIILVQNETIDIQDLPMSILRILFLCSLIVVLVFVN